MRWFSGLRVTAKIGVAFGCILVTMMVSSALIYVDMKSTETTVAARTLTMRVRMSLQQLLASVIDQETGLRGYLVSGDPAFLEPYRRGRTSYDRIYADLFSTMQPNSEQRTRLGELDASARHWQREIAEREIALMDGGQRDAARAVEAGGAGKASMDAVRDKVAEIDGVAERILTVRDAATKAAYVDAERMMLAGAALALVIALAWGWLLTRAIARPVGRITACMHRLAGRDVSVAIPDVGRGDEIGRMAAAVQIFKDNILASDRLAVEQQADQSAKAERSARHLGLVSGFEEQMREIAGLLSDASALLQSRAQAMADNASQTKSQAVYVEQAAETASSGVQSVAAAAEELSASIGEITRQVTESARMTDETAAEARRTDGIVRALSEGAARIGDVVSLISGIAGQTNLLALNATIEAARAGEAGKGFAVVASEVKSLASQTARATDEIGVQIARVQSAIGEAVAAIDGIAGRVERMSAIAATVASAVDQQGGATAEISRNIQQTATSTQQVSASIASVSMAASETGATASELLASAVSLSNHSERLRDEVSGFGRKVTAI